MKTLRHLRIIAVAVLLLLFACREEQEFVKQNNLSLSQTSIGYKKLSEIPGLEKSVNKVKEQISANNLINKSVGDFEIDEDNILVVDFQSKATINVAVVDGVLSQTDYSVTNLNIVKQNGIETYFLTRYTPADGKPFYSFSDFIGTIEYLDLNGKPLTNPSMTYANKEETFYVTVGCTMIAISGCDVCSNVDWEVVGIYNVCGGGGGNSTPTVGGNNGGSQSGGGAGGGGTSGSTSPPTLPNIPTENIARKKMYTSFLRATLSDFELAFLIQSGMSDMLFEYMDSHDFSAASRNYSKWFMRFYSYNHNIDPMEYFEFGTHFLENNPDTTNPENIFLRINALDKFLKQNPDGLLDIPCSQLPHWQDISSYPIPQNVKNKINSIPNQNSYWSSWAVTDLESGAGPRVNMDLFPVKINSLPNKPGTNQKYTASEFFDFFRKNINLFAEKFEPIEDNYYNIHDKTLWNSSNPLGALVHINIPVDDGTVICSGFSSNTWIFTTIKAPLSWSYDGIHPVAGNRKFSYYTDPNDGSVTIYTRGVDRLSSINSSDTPLINFLMESTAFLGADLLWSGMQTKLSNYVNSNGGSAIKVNPEVYRPNYSIIKDYLKGKSSLAALGCK
ncbi:hypothetical protein [Epilithonimonas sp.]|uniref:hypothetical protein n=1 Tax=Epilithonimonas sp. TaxID=2894511 RepID=UPI0035AD9A0B